MLRFCPLIRVILYSFGWFLTQWVLWSVRLVGIYFEFPDRKSPCLPAAGRRSSQRSGGDSAHRASIKEGAWRPPTAGRNIRLPAAPAVLPAVRWVQVSSAANALCRHVLVLQVQLYCRCARLPRVSGKFSISREASAVRQGTLTQLFAFHSFRIDFSLLLLFSFLLLCRNESKTQQQTRCVGWKWDFRWIRGEFL